MFVFNYRIGFSVSSFLPTSDTKDLEVTYKDLMDNVTQMIEKFISKMGNYNNHIYIYIKYYC